MGAVSDQLIEVLIRTFEGGLSTIKGDEPTALGLNAAVHPTFVKAYFAAAAANDTVALARLRQEAEVIYFGSYIRPIPGWDWMETNFPALLGLLFLGRVHGSGYRDYVLEIQRWAQKNVNRGISVDGRLGPLTLAMVKGLSVAQRKLLLDNLKSQPVQERLTSRRQAAVRMGGVQTVDRGIANRVRREFEVAMSIHTDEAARVVLNNPDGGPKPLEVTYARTTAKSADLGEDDESRLTIGLV